MTRCNDLSEQMGVGADDDRHDPRDHEPIRTPCPYCGECGWRWSGGWRYSECPPCAAKRAERDAETPEPCRGCGQTDCGEQCAAFRAWLTVAWLAVDTADRASQAAYTHRWGDAAEGVG